MSSNLRSWPPASSPSPLAVLVSGGADSAILVGEALTAYPAVYPLYVRTGLNWENVEIQHLRAYLSAIESSALRPLHVLHIPVDDVYGSHWSITGQDVPDEKSPDAAVFLPGRNVLLLSKGMLWCHMNGVRNLALAHLGGNPFPDATPEFIAAFTEVVNRAVNGCMSVIRPYAHSTKAEVLRRGLGLPLEKTFSCMRPIAGRHCGCCNKCAERQKAFAAAGMADPTSYAK